MADDHPDLSALQSPVASPTIKRKRSISEQESPDRAKKTATTNAPSAIMSAADVDTAAFIENAVEAAAAAAANGVNVADLNALQQATAAEHSEAADPANASSTAAAALGSMYPSIHVPQTTEAQFASQGVNDGNHVPDSAFDPNMTQHDTIIDSALAGLPSSGSPHDLTPPNDQQQQLTHDQHQQMPQHDQHQHDPHQHDQHQQHHLDQHPHMDPQHQQHQHLEQHQQQQQQQHEQPPPQPQPAQHRYSTGSAGAPPKSKPDVGSDEWHKQRKDNHKEVERRRRETINEGINELAKIVPNCEKNKGSILQRAVTFINLLKENESQNLEKWTLEKLLTEQAIAELSTSNDKLKQECERLYKELETWKRVAQNAGLSLPQQNKDEAPAAI
ncbi:putative bHLH domain-containing protein C3F10.12c like [Verticillium longisporum]|nr:putative bHLH domain-containing protein C3F10.12c like [Verticillium longisporum]